MANSYAIDAAKQAIAFLIPGRAEPPGAGRAAQSGGNPVLNVQNFIQSRNGTSPLSLYINAVLCRAGYFNNTDVFNALKAAIGADSFAVITSWNPLLPNVVFWHWNGVGGLLQTNGTTNIAQWANQILQSDQVNFPPFGKVFSSFYSIAQGMTAGIQAGVINQLGPNESLALIGHSLGGAINHIWSNIFIQASNWGPLLCTTFGSPRIGNRDYRAPGIPYCTRVVIEQDPVTQVPPAYFVRSAFNVGVLAGPPIPAGYVHPAARRVGLNSYRMSLSEGTSDESDGGRKTLNGMYLVLDQPGVPSIAQFHRIGNYCDQLYAQLELFQLKYPFVKSIRQQDLYMDSNGG